MPLSLARMDTDDIAKKDRFEKQLNIFSENSNVDIVGSCLDEFEDNIKNIITIAKNVIKEI